MTVETLVQHNGEKLGYIQNGVLIKVPGAVALYEPMDGFGMPTEVIEKGIITHPSIKTGTYKSFIVSHVEIHHDGKTYQATIDTFRKHGVKLIDSPFEAQYILQRKYFMVIDPKELEAT